MTYDENNLWYEDLTKKFLIITEKPSQQKALKAVLPKTQNIIMSSLAGHIMRLQNPEEYDKKYTRGWIDMVKARDIPFFPDDFVRIVKEKDPKSKFRTNYRDIYTAIKNAISTVDYIVYAMDPDNEGCALGHEVILDLKAEKKVIGMINMSRLDFFSMQQEIKSINKIDYESMAWSGFARSEFDWSFGINGTIAATVLLGGGDTLHIGGVKLPVVAMAVERDEHIEKFQPVPYWQWKGEAKHVKSGKKFQFIIKVKKDKTELNKMRSKLEGMEKEIELIKEENIENDPRLKSLMGEFSTLRWEISLLEKEIETSERDIFDTTVRDAVDKSVKPGIKLKVSDFSKKMGLLQSAPLAYSLTDLQAEAGAQHRFSPAKTLDLAQKLYEEQVQSYPRTDSRYYSAGEMANIKKIIPNLIALPEFSSVNVPLPYKVKTGVYNNAKVHAHTGLSPTTKEATNLSGDMKTIYNMVATRYLIQFMDKFEYYKVEVSADINESVYLSTFENIETKRGWRDLYDPNNMYGFTYSNTQKMPDMAQGDDLEILSIEREDLATIPKPHFNQFSLLKAMENISRIYDDLNGLEKGIGTPATRASIIEQLFKGKYLAHQKGGKVVATDKAKVMIHNLPAEMYSPKLRADMEEKLMMIVDRKFTREAFQSEFKILVKEHIDKIYKYAKENNIEIVDKDTLPPTEAQIKFATNIAKELKIKIPDKALALKKEMIAWIDVNEKKMKIELSEKQVAFIKKYCETKEITDMIEKSENLTLTKADKKKVSIWLGQYMRTPEYYKKRAAGNKGRTPLTEEQKAERAKNKPPKKPAPSKKKKINRPVLKADTPKSNA